MNHVMHTQHNSYITHSATVKSSLHQGWAMRGDARHYTSLYLTKVMRQGKAVVTLPLSALLPLPDVTRLAPVIQAISAHAVSGEVASRLLLATRLAHLPNLQISKACAGTARANSILHVLNPWAPMS